MAFPLWGTIKSYILGAWSWLDNIEDKIQDVALSRWFWLDDLPGWVWGWWWPRFRAELTMATALGEVVWDLVYGQLKARWTWLDTIDDRIRDLAWAHIAPKLGDWLWSFVVLEVTFVSKIGYRVLRSLWDMEWDDENKEAK